MVSRKTARADGQSRRDTSDAFATALPDKQYFKIGEVAAIAGVKTSVLRYWETQFAKLRPEKNRANQRLYSRRDVLAVLELKDLLYTRRFTIDGARQHLRTGRLVSSREKLMEKLKQELRELLQLVAE